MSSIAASLILVIDCTWFAGAPKTKVRHDKPKNKSVTIQKTSSLRSRRTGAITAIFANLLGASWPRRIKQPWQLFQFWNFGSAAWSSLQSCLEGAKRDASLFEPWSNGGEPAQPPQQLSTRLSESRGGQGLARPSLGGPGWPSHRGGGGSWQSRKPSDFWARERADLAAAIAALLPHHSRARLPQA